MAKITEIPINRVRQLATTLLHLRNGHRDKFIASGDVAYLVKEGFVVRATSRTGNYYAITDEGDKLIEHGIISTQLR